MNTKVQRRSLGQVVKKAPQQLWQKHKVNFEKNLFDPNTQFADKISISSSEHAKKFSSSSYSIFPVRSSVLPLFAPDAAKMMQQQQQNHQRSTKDLIFSFDYRATGFVWPLYKPPFLKMLNNNSSPSSRTSSTNENFKNNSVEEFVEKAFDFGSSAFSSSSNNNNNKLVLEKCPFQMAAKLELTKLRQILESSNSDSNNMNVMSKEDRNQLRREMNGNDDFVDDELYDSYENGPKNRSKGLTNNKNEYENEFLHHNRKMFARAEALSGLGITGEQERMRRRNLLKAATAAEIPHVMAFHWANMMKWHYEFGTIMANDVSGVVPVAVMEEHVENKNVMFSDLISRATFEAVIEGHIPRSLPSARMEMFSSSSSLNENNSNNNLLFTKMMKNGKDEFTAASSLLNSSTMTLSTTTDDSQELSNVEIASANVVRHGYYLQEPVTVVRWVLTGRNCARASPNEILNKIFSPVVTNKDKKFKKNSSSASAPFFVVGHPASRMTHKYDISIPMCCLRGVHIGDSSSSNNQSSSNENSNRIIALPRSPYASEEMISIAPNSARLQDAVRRANLMDGYWTP